MVHEVELLQEVHGEGGEVSTHRTEAAGHHPHGEALDVDEEEPTQPGQGKEMKTRKK